MARTADPKVIWSPQDGPQTALIACKVFEVLFGGARGGGKTEGSIGDWLDHSNRWGESATGVFFRRKSTQLEEVIARTHQIFPHIGANFNVQQKTWQMKNGARLKFRYLERDTDAEEYQGHSYTRVYVEEVTNFPTPKPLNKLRATLRSTTVPQEEWGMRLTGNPGGPGHNWVKDRFIKPAPGGWTVITERIPTLNGRWEDMERIFIPSRLEHNRLLMAQGDRYVAQLRQSGSEQLVRAWLEGNWDLVDGAFFDCWGPQHVLESKEWLHKIPTKAMRFRSMDWGYARPFSIGWWVVSDGTWGLPRDAIVKYREWYGSDGRPNVGLRLNPDQVAAGILAREAGEDIEYGVCDPSMFIRDGGPSIAEGMILAGVNWRRGDNRREPGWTEMRRRMTGHEGVPLIYWMTNCADSVRTIPTLQHDETDAEDLDTNGEDHVADETRYACMSRPFTTESVEPEEPSYLPKLPHQMTINELLANKRAKRLAAQE